MPRAGSGAAACQAAGLMALAHALLESSGQAGAGGRPLQRPPGEASTDLAPESHIRATVLGGHSRRPPLPAQGPWQTPAQVLSIYTTRRLLGGPVGQLRPAGRPSWHRGCARQARGAASSRPVFAETPSRLTEARSAPGAPGRPDESELVRLLLPASPTYLTGSHTACLSYHRRSRAPQLLPNRNAYSTGGPLPAPIRGCEGTSSPTRPELPSWLRAGRRFFLRPDPFGARPGARGWGPEPEESVTASSEKDLSRDVSRADSGAVPSSSPGSLLSAAGRPALRPGPWPVLSASWSPPDPAWCWASCPGLSTPGSFSLKTRGFRP